MNWTPESEKHLAEFFAENRSRLCADGADAAEVEGDIRRHVDEELREKGTDVVTVEALHRILRDFAGHGEPEPEEYVPPRPKFLVETPKVVCFSPKARRIIGTWSFWFFAILLPALTLGIEVVSHFCAGAFFDPVPTVWHAALVGLVPVTNYLLYRALNEKMPARPRRLLMLGGVSILVGVYYTLLFLPLYPYACVGIVAYGIGFLPLASGTALLGTILATRRLRRRLEDETVPTSGIWKRPVLAGFVLGVLALGALEIPKYLGRAGLHLAASESPDTSRFGLALLRTCGSEATVLRACYEPNGEFQRLTDTAGWVFRLLEDVPNDEVREIYYRMTGNAFNAVSPPRMNSRSNRNFWNDFQFDEERGGTSVGARLAGLKAESSRIDLHVDPVSSLYYSEWTLVFENAKGTAQEARFEAQLPPGGVVSRLTLWVNGEPQEAAFGTRSAVRAAYQKVAIQQQRDPVLVTTTGPDRVLVQCFPVPANKGTMKIRLGITAPVSPEGAGKGCAWLPHFTERNFSIVGIFTHSIWAQSRQKLESPLASLATEIGKDDSAFALRGEVSDVALSGNDARVVVEGIDPALGVWSPNPLARAGAEAPVILREASGATWPAHTHVYVVLDTSTGMAAQWPALRESLGKLPADAPVTVIAADDNVAELTAGRIREGLDVIRPRGGKDNSAALLHALAAAGAEPGSAIVWIHAPQPVLLADPEALAQRLERSFAQTPIHDLPLAPGPNRVLDAINAFTRTHAAPRGIDAGKFIAGLLVETPQPRAWSYRTLAPGEAVPDDAVEVWDHLARYAAYEQVMAAHFGEASAEEPKNVPEFAARHQLVTPYTGAVVLETAQQFADAGLDQIDASVAPAIPTIPEPSTPLLMLVAATGWLLRRRRVGN